MNAISAPEPDDSKQSDRHKAKEAIEPFFNDWAGDAQGKLLKDDDTPVPVFDGQAALDRVNGNRDLLGRMVGVFAIQWRERLANIAGAVSRRNGFELERVANQLKKSLGSVGAVKASRVAQEFEEFAGKGRFLDLESRLRELEVEIERVLSALREFSKESVPHAIGVLKVMHQPSGAS